MQACGFLGLRISFTAEIRKRIHGDTDRVIGSPYGLFKYLGTVETLDQLKQPSPVPTAIIENASCFVTPYISAKLLSAYCL